MINIVKWNSVVGLMTETWYVYLCTHTHTYICYVGLNILESGMLNMTHTLACLRTHTQIDETHLWKFWNRQRKKTTTIDNDVDDSHGNGDDTKWSDEN